MTDSQTKALELFEKALKRADKANGAVAAVQAEADTANAELNWYAAHPALAGIDLNAVVERIRSEVATPDSAPEPDGQADGEATEAPAEKPKRRRRTKAEMQAAREAEAAAKAAAAGESVQPTEPAPVEQPAEEPTVAADEDVEPDVDEGENDDTFSEAEQERPAAAAPALQSVGGGATVNPFAQGGAPAQPAATPGFLNPFAQK